ncbi:hypothetical protein K0I73_16665 [Shewanella mesophila]|uniref:hypothetical protein n=1 Tax=Shewanella mesophila TaxID=2864208 RepID=UPI001C661A0E|nr:hypothetical protein [Shewanella mesophila]QYJ85783.1 hypothetical protein K0I73_16665 [Shewanella mesophila]
MSEQFHCWQCGKALEALILPMSRREECIACHADQHVCKMCVFFNDSGRGDCREDRAEWISDRERANFCDYFKPAVGHMDNKNMANAQAMAEFAELFGEVPPFSNKAAPEKAESGKAADRPKTAAQIAEQQLRDLLGG